MNRNMIRQAQQLQAQLAKAQEDLESATVQATSGGNAVRVVITGKLKVQSIEIAAEAVDPTNVDLLQDMVLAALNDGLDKAQEMASQKLSSITGGMKIPGFM